MPENINKIYRGDEWEVELNEIKGTLAGNFRILNTNDRRSFNPLSETPDLFLRFYELGILFWEKTTAVVILKEKITEFLNNFSYLDSSISLNEEISADFFFHQAKTISQIISIINDNEDKLASVSLISLRILDLLEYEYKTSQKIKDISSMERYEARLKEFEHIVKKENQNEKLEAINKWSIEEIKHQLERSPCVNQIELSIPEKIYRLVLKPESLKAAIWFQVADILISKKHIKSCSYLLCKKLYSTTRSQRAYCSSSCQTRAKSYRAYHHLSNESSKSIKRIKREKTLQKPVTKQALEVINKEVISNSGNFSTIPEYDADFGFFENEESEKRILGQ